MERAAKRFFDAEIKTREDELAVLKKVAHWIGLVNVGDEARLRCELEIAIAEMQDEQSSSASISFADRMQATP